MKLLDLEPRPKHFAKRLFKACGDQNPEKGSIVNHLKAR